MTSIYVVAIVNGAPCVLDTATSIHKTDLADAILAILPSLNNPLIIVSTTPERAITTYNFVRQYLP